MKLKDKTILVTGASSGIGRAVAIRAAEDKCRVLLAARSEEKLNRVKEEIEKKGSEGVVMSTDVTKDDQIEKLFLKATEGGRVLDVVFNNAGLGYVAPIYNLAPEEIRKMLEVNTIGMIMVSRFASEVMMKQQYGHLIMTSSLAGLVTLPEWSVYCASKWAITGFADSIRTELKKFKVRVTTLHPGLVKTDFFAKEKANLDIKEIDTTNDALTPQQVAEEVYEAIFTDKEKIITPRMSKNFALLYKFIPGIVKAKLEKMAEGAEAPKRDEGTTTFSHVQCVTCEKKN